MPRVSQNHDGSPKRRLEPIFLLHEPLGTIDSIRIATVLRYVLDLLIVFEYLASALSARNSAYSEYYSIIRKCSYGSVESGVGASGVALAGVCSRRSESTTARGASCAPTSTGWVWGRYKRIQDGGAHVS
jgi:hypothetical protein